MAAGKKKPRISREDALELLFALAEPPEAETVPAEDCCPPGNVVETTGLEPVTPCL